MVTIQTEMYILLVNLSVFLQNQGEELLQTLKTEGEKFDAILEVSRRYLEVFQKTVQTTEEYFTKYGYQKPGKFLTTLRHSRPTKCGINQYSSN
jgi:hypothetical protein